MKFTDDTYGVIGEGNLKRIFRDYGTNIDDVTTALNKLAQQGILRSDKGTNTSRRTIYMPGDGMKERRAYLFVMGDGG